MIHTHFISVDWGTSNIRIRYVKCNSLSIIEEVSSNQGIKTIYDAWQQQGGTRERHYLNFLKSQIAQFSSDISPETLVIISGMASSSIGLRELPYASLPFETNGKSLYSESIAAPYFPYPVQLISGVQSDDDVIRGEETELIGLIEESTDDLTTIYITPGTHSKHVIIQKNSITQFHTYMTGELFQILTEHSILKDTLTKGSFSETAKAAFKQGVLEAHRETSVLNSLFKSRTNILFQKYNKEENYFFLSGTLIGEELANLTKTSYDSIQLCAGGPLFELYLEAIKTLELFSKTTIVPKDLVDTAAMKGHWKIIQNQLL